MFYPKCPACGGRSKSIEPDSFEYGNRHAKHWLHGQAMAGHPHPLLKTATLAVTVGRELYKRLGGRKQCTACGHEFS